MLLGGIVIFTPSCTPPDFSSPTSTVDSLKTELDSSYARFSAVNTDSLQHIQDSIEKHLDYIQKNYVGPMLRGMGKDLGDYRMVKKMVPSAASRAEEVELGIELARNQLSGLRTALADGSTHDALGNKLTPEYVTTLVREETIAASALIKEMNLITERSVPMITHFNTLYPKVRFWIDSIPLKTGDNLMY